MALSTKNKGAVPYKVILLAGLLGVTLLAGLSSCATQRRYELLTFFFDGVPDPNAPPPEKSESSSKKQGPRAKTAADVPLPLFFVHEPYAERSCDDCHESKFSQTLVKEPPALCFGCHGKMTKKMTFIHDPVKEGSCSDCHEPHKSRYEFLLTRSMPKLCGTCHDSLWDLDVVHEPVRKGECASCHNPHGGTDKFFLVETGDGLCLECHEQEPLLKTEAHKDLGLQRCMDCHDPHQTDRPHLLKASI